MDPGGLDNHPATAQDFYRVFIAWSSHFPVRQGMLSRPSAVLFWQQMEFLPRTRVGGDGMIGQLSQPRGSFSPEPKVGRGIGLGFGGAQAAANGAKHTPPWAGARVWLGNVSLGLCCPSTQRAGEAFPFPNLRLDGGWAALRVYSSQPESGSIGRCRADRSGQSGRQSAVFLPQPPRLDSPLLPP